jgi:multidrug efflux pump subunit AcrA (membrane-fusion protein)
MTAYQTDLQALSVRRSGPSGPTLRPPRRWLSRFLLPLALLVGFAGLVVYASWEFLLPAAPVSVTPVIAHRGIVQAAGVELFSATGWIEPRPTPIEVTALAEGVVEELLVLPSQVVQKNQVVARLIDRDARLALEVVEQDLAERLVRVDSAKAELADAQAQFTAAQVAFRAEETLYQNNATFKVRFEQARAQYHSAQAKVKQAESRLKETQVRVRQGQVAVDAAQLRLERMQVRAPAAGVVMQINTVPGRMVGVRSVTPGVSDSLIMLYDPNSLQARVGVPLSKFQFVRPGQPAWVEVDVAAGERLLGTVLFDTHEVDANNTRVVVKVAIVRPPAATLHWPTSLPGMEHSASELLMQSLSLTVQELQGPLKKLRPGMLATARFISPAIESQESGGEVLRLMIPRRLVLQEGNQARVWIVNQAESRAQLAPVSLGRGTQGDFVEVAEGLLPSDKLITTGRERLTAGQRLRIAAEE